MVTSWKVPFKNYIGCNWMFLPIDQSEIEKGKKVESGIYVTMHRKNISTHP